MRVDLKARPHKVSTDNMTIYLDRKVVQWCTKVKYLGLYLTGGANFKIDLTVAKRKYYGSFNNIRSVVGRQVNEIMVLHLIKSYCLPCMDVKFGH